MKLDFKESLKVLHHYLEGLVSAKANVGFVAITNYVLTGTKTNRCASLLRQEPGQGERNQVLEDVPSHIFKEKETLLQSSVAGQSSVVGQQNRFASLLSPVAYKNVLEMKDGDFNEFYGLREFI